jgi:predicted RNase H-like HicB family nuclease
LIKALKEGSPMDLTIEFEQEEDGRWIAEVINLPGVLAYGQNQEDAAARVKALALRVLADQIEQGERSSALDHIAFLAA